MGCNAGAVGNSKAYNGRAAQVRDEGRGEEGGKGGETHMWRRREERHNRQAARTHRRANSQTGEEGKRRAPRPNKERLAEASVRAQEKEGALKRKKTATTKERQRG